MPTAQAPAKINLWLRVLARERSGYHQIESLFCRLALADTLQLEDGTPGIHLEVRGADLGAVEDNLVHRAATAFFRAIDQPPAVRMVLRKRIPAAAGMGGGSSDAAATLLALDRAHGRPLGSARLLELGATLGSDVPFFLSRAKLALAWGRGERLLTLPPLPARPVLLAIPGMGISTPAAYAALDRLRPTDQHPPVAVSAAAFADWRSVARHAMNDLEVAAMESFPHLAAVKDMLRNCGARPALLAGSGSAVFGVFPSAPARDRARDRLLAAFPGLTTVRTRTTGP